MVPSRRAVLHAVGLTAVSLAGCLGDTSVDPPVAATAEAPQSTTSESTPVTTTRRPSESTAPDSTTPRPTRPRGKPVSTRRAYVDGEEYTYLSEENAVQYVSAYRHTNREAIENGSKPEREPVYDTVSFERWARVRCVSVAASAVAETTAERLGRAELDASVGVTSRGGVPTVVVSRTITYDRQGNRVFATDVPFEDLVAVAPRWVETTVSLATQEYETTIPVWVRVFEQWQQ